MIVFHVNFLPLLLYLFSTPFPSSIICFIPEAYFYLTFTWSVEFKLYSYYLFHLQSLHFIVLLLYHSHQIACLIHRWTQASQYISILLGFGYLGSRLWWSSLYGPPVSNRLLLWSTLKYYFSLSGVLLRRDLPSSISERSPSQLVHFTTLKWFKFQSIPFCFLQPLS